jgi:5-hydroxyisourate hydrolase-like protein (transthyretin family)
MLRGPAVLVLTLLLSSTLSSRQIPTIGNIEGTVVRADTGTPITGAQVTLMAAAGPQRIATQPVSTDADGKFALKDVAPGGYRVAANVSGFVRQEYGQKASSGLGRTIFVIAGQTTKNIGIRLLPTGTVSGRVFDENGQPATGAPVQLLRPVYNARGRTLEQAGVATANDRGEYRAYGVPPGRYFLLAGTPAGDPRIVLRGPAAPPSSTRFSLVYYPNATESDQASFVEVNSGAETAIDMNVRRQVQTFRVRGRVIGIERAILPENLKINLVVRLQNGSGFMENLATFKADTGTFEFLDVVPGDYYVQATTAARGERPAIGGGLEQATEATRLSSMATVRVMDRDVEGIALSLSSGVTVSGRVIVEEQSAASIPNVDRLGLRFDFPMPVIGMTAPVALPLAGDGSFQVVGLREGEYRADLYAPTGFYVKNLRYGGEDISGNTFRFSGSGSGAFEIVLRPGGVQVSGTLTDSRSDLVPGMPVFLVPAEKKRTDLYRQTTTDRVGKFTMAAVPPGDYKLFSWETVDNGAQFDPAFVQEYERVGKAIHVTETAPVTADIRTIPPIRP